jgi:hypothetical protein
MGRCATGAIRSSCQSVPFSASLRQQTAGVVLMLSALVVVGSCEHEQDFDLLDVYCYVSDKARTKRAASVHLLWEEQLLDYLYRGWDRVEARGIDLDKWMAR